MYWMILFDTPALRSGCANFWCHFRSLKLLSALAVISLLTCSTIPCTLCCLNVIRSAMAKLGSKYGHSFHMSFISG